MSRHGGPSGPGAVGPVELERWAGLQQFIGAERVPQGLRDVGVSPH
jgi:hypothetical protein